MIDSCDAAADETEHARARGDDDGRAGFGDDARVEGELGTAIDSEGAHVVAGYADGRAAAGCEPIEVEDRAASSVAEVAFDRWAKITEAASAGLERRVAVRRSDGLDDGNITIGR